MERGTSGSCTTWVGAVKKTTMLVFYSFCVFMYVKSEFDVSKSELRT